MTAAIGSRADRAKAKAVRVGLLVLAVLLSAMGCTRTCYRRQADGAAYGLVQSKTCDPRWPLEDYTIEIRPESRMYDPDNRDFPPMPPDDPESHKLMHCVYGMKGYPYWHAHGDTPFVQNPTWLASLPLNENGQILIDSDSAVRLGLLNSTNYQSSLEELYLSALDVSFERFRFDTQFFAGYSVFYTADGRARPGSGGQSSSVLNLSTFPNSTNLSLSKMNAAGGELVVGLANSLIWQFAGPDSHAAATLLDFSFIQPLLRAGGRAVVLERLTIAERALLANIRQMEFYRRGFYLEIVTGQFAGQGPSRRGGFFGGSGLEGFTGVGGQGFGRVGGFAGNFFNGNFGFAGGAGAGQAGGYLGLLQTQQALRNQRATIASLRSSVAQLESFFRAGRIDYFQVELARQALFNTESQLLNAEQQFQSTFDQFKINLGVPPYLDLTLDESLIQPFQLVESNLVDTENEITELQEQAGQRIVSILESVRPGRDSAAGEEEATAPDPTEGAATSRVGSRHRAASRIGSHPSRHVANPPARRPGLVREILLVAAEDHSQQLTWSTSLQEQLQELGEILTSADQKRESTLKRNLPVIRQDVSKLRSAIQPRLAVLKRLQETVYPRLMATLSQGTPRELDPATGKVQSGNAPQSIIIPINQEMLKKLPNQLDQTLAEVTREFAENASESKAIQLALAAILEEGPELSSEELGRRVRDKILLPLPNVLNSLSANVLSLTLVQARARTESVMIVAIDLNWQEAYATALQNRLDLMNARANLVDTWRLIQFNANALESRLDLVFSGDISNTGDNPLRLRSSTGRLRVGLQFEAPLRRVAERNLYRQALIEYQQARRTFYQFEDQIAAGLRATLRSLDVNQLNFEFRRVAVEVAIAQVELTRLRLQEPPKPDVEGQFGATTARDLVSALADLLVVQNDFLSVWVNQEVLRRGLDRDMGTMQLDASGLWVDPGPIVDVVPIRDGRLPPTDQEQPAPEPLPDLPRRAPAGPELPEPPAPLDLPPPGDLSLQRLATLGGLV